MNKKNTNIKQNILVKTPIIIKKKNSKLKLPDNSDIKNNIIFNKPKSPNTLNNINKNISNNNTKNKNNINSALISKGKNMNNFTKKVSKSPEHGNLINVKYLKGFKIPKDKIQNNKVFISSKKPKNILIKKNIEKQNNNNKEKINSTNTFDKVILLQKLIKEMNSISRRSSDIFDKLNEQINQKCYEYFKNKIFIKEIFDYYANEKNEEHKDYILVENNSEYFQKNIYQMIYDFYFLIRNENSIMLKLIKLSNIEDHQELSDFFVNFLYENVINDSYFEDELILMIYLLLEDLFFDSFPLNLNLKNNNNNLYNFLIIKNSFLFFTFQSLTKKLEVRNFLSSILSNIILKMESFRNPLSVDFKIANRFLKKRDKNIFHSFALFANGEQDMIKKNKKLKNDLTYNQGFGLKGNQFLKRTKKIVLGTSAIFNDVAKNEKLPELNDIINSDKKLDKLNNIYLNNEININKKEDDTKLSEGNIDDINNNLNISKELKIKEINKEDIEIDIFFENNNVTLNYLKEKLPKMKNISTIREINSAMTDYIKNLINKIKSNKRINSNIDINLDEDMDMDTDFDSQDDEIFSTSLIIDELKTMGSIKNVDSFKQLMAKIKSNYKIITKIVSSIINNINDNLISSPNIIKYISKLMSILLFKKFNRVSGNKLTDLNIYIFKINFFFGNIILPILKNPEINGIITSEIISQMTKDNMNIISEIFNKIISVELFDIYKQPYMTIFNPFIIDIMPQIFEIVENLDKNFFIPLSIQKLINEINLKRFARNVNYDYFKQNKNEDIEYQTICFSWKNFNLILQILLKNRNTFLDNLNNFEYKSIIGKIIANKDIINNFIRANEKNKKEEFFLLTKINFSDEFNKKLSLLRTGNFNTNNPKNYDDEIIYFKKCLLDILGFVNYLHEESWLSFILGKNEVLYSLDSINQFTKNKGKNKKDNNINNNYNYNYNIKKILSIGLLFRKNIFPKILENIKFEIGYGLEDSISQYILFCCDYLNIHIKNIPKKYSRNNFDLLFTELIREIKFKIEYLKNNSFFKYYTKIKEIEKNIFLISKYSSQIRNFEKLKAIEYLYNQIKLQNELIISKDSNGIIENIQYKSEENEINIHNNNINIMDYLKNQNQSISYFIEDFPDFREYEDNYDNILNLQEKSNTPEAIYNYFKAMKNMIKKDQIIDRFNKEEIKEIIYDFQNYIFTLLYDKLFPSEPMKDDIFFYKKCSRLNFIKPENVIKEKNLINENLMNKAIEYINDIDDQLTPSDKIKDFAKAIDIIQNCINFISGQKDLGVDDIIKPLIYIIIKSKPKNMLSNYQYCELYLNSELAKMQYGIILSQIGLVIECIKKMKYTDLINISEEEFGIDEEI